MRIVSAPKEETKYRGGGFSMLGPRASRITHAGFSITIARLSHSGLGGILEMVLEICPLVDWMLSSQNSAASTLRLRQGRHSVRKFTFTHFHLVNVCGGFKTQDTKHQTPACRAAHNKTDIASRMKRSINTTKRGMDVMQQLHRNQNQQIMPRSVQCLVPTVCSSLHH